MAWRTPSRSTTTAVTVYPFCVQVATASPTSSLASGADNFCMVTTPWACAPVGIAPTTPTSASTMACSPAETRDLDDIGVLPVDRCRPLGHATCQLPTAAVASAASAP